MTMIRRSLLLGAAAALLLVLASTGAHAGGKIALLISMDDGPFKEVVGGFCEHLNKQGAQASYELFSLEGSTSKTSTAIQKIKQNGFSLVLSLGSLATDAAVKEVTGIPVVAGMVLRTDALKRSQNATGVGLEYPFETQLAWLQKMLPQVGTVGVLYNPQENKKRVDAANRVAQKLGLKLETQEVSSSQEIPDALDRLAKKAEVLWGMSDTVVLSPQTSRQILIYSFRNNIPFIGPSSMWVKAGALYALDYDYRDIGSQCGEMALKLLNGTPVSDVPPTTPRNVKYSLNMTSARQMRVSLDDTLVRGALTTY